MQLEEERIYIISSQTQNYQRLTAITYFPGNMSNCVVDILLTDISLNRYFWISLDAVIEYNSVNSISRGFCDVIFSLCNKHEFLPHLVLPHPWQLSMPLILHHTSDQVLQRLEHLECLGADIRIIQVLGDRYFLLHG